MRGRKQATVMLLSNRRVDRESKLDGHNVIIEDSNTSYNQIDDGAASGAGFLNSVDYPTVEISKPSTRTFHLPADALAPCIKIDPSIAAYAELSTVVAKSCTKVLTSMASPLPNRVNTTAISTSLQVKSKDLRFNFKGLPCDIRLMVYENGNILQMTWDGDLPALQAAVEENVKLCQEVKNAYMRLNASFSIWRDEMSRFLITDDHVLPERVQLQQIKYLRVRWNLWNDPSGISTFRGLERCTELETLMVSLDDRMLKNFDLDSQGCIVHEALQLFQPRSLEIRFFGPTENLAENLQMMRSTGWRTTTRFRNCFTDVFLPRKDVTICNLVLFLDSITGTEAVLARTIQDNFEGRKSTAQVWVWKSEQGLLKITASKKSIKRR